MWILGTNMLAPKINVANVGSGEGGSQTALNTHKHLSPFQVEKFTYLFEAFFDLEKNNLIEQDDIEAFVEKMRVYAGWDKSSKQAGHLKDVEATFYECVQDQVKAEYLADDGDPEEAKLPWEEAFQRHKKVDVSRMNLTQWLNMWGRLCYKSAGIADFPIWVQLLPDILFQVMDRDQDGILSYNEVKNFYQEFVGINDELDRIAKEGYRVLTANGDYTLNRNHYFFCFANFLLGKSIYGPGKYIFGIFDNRELNESYKVIYNVGADD